MSVSPCNVRTSSRLHAKLKPGNAGRRLDSAGPGSGFPRSRHDGYQPDPIQRDGLPLECSPSPSGIDADDLHVSQHFHGTSGEPASHCDWPCLHSSATPCQHATPEASLPHAPLIRLHMRLFCSPLTVFPPSGISLSSVRRRFEACLRYELKKQLTGASSIDEH